MRITEAIKIFETLISRTDKKRDLKIYQSFITILTELKSRNFTQDQQQLIEKELEGFDLNRSEQYQRKYFKKNLERFKGHLKEVFALIPEGHYASLGIGIGMTFGVCLGISFGSVLGLPDGGSGGSSLGMLAGMFIGLLIGRAKDAEAKKQGNVYRVK
jgi:hypothetical protein